MENNGKHNGLRVVWIGFQDRESRIKEYISKNSVQKNVVFDAGDALAKQYGVRYGAGVVIVDSSGVVRARISKGFSEKQLRDALMNVSKIKTDLEGQAPAR